MKEVYSKTPEINFEGRDFIFGKVKSILSKDKDDSVEFVDSSLLMCGVTHENIIRANIKLKAEDPIKAIKLILDQQEIREIAFQSRINV